MDWFWMSIGTWCSYVSQSSLNVSDRNPIQVVQTLTAKLQEGRLLTCWRDGCWHVGLFERWKLRALRALPSLSVFLSFHFFASLGPACCLPSPLEDTDGPSGIVGMWSIHLLLSSFPLWSHCSWVWITAPSASQLTSHTHLLILTWLPILQSSSSSLN